MVRSAAATMAGVTAGTYAGSATTIGLAPFLTPFGSAVVGTVVGAVVGWAVTNIYDKITAPYAAREAPTTSYMYSGGRDPFTGEGYGFKIRMEVVPPPSSSHQDNRSKEFGNSSPDNNISSMGYIASLLGGPPSNGGGGSGGGLGLFGGSALGLGLASSANSQNGGGLAALIGGMNSKGGSSGADVASSPGGRSEFGQNLQGNGLADSYNGGWDSVFFLGALTGDIGGVASKVGLLEDLIDSGWELDDYHLISIRTNTNESPFSDFELQQIMREIAVAVYSEDTYPFFSLHFNDSGVLYPVIHPTFKNSLVGTVISYLDYYMKGFLNGGTYPKEFIDSWDTTMDTNRDSLRPHLIDLKNYYKKEKIPYKSLREAMAEAGLEGETTNDSVFQNKFRTSFRIISNLKKVERHDNVFIVEADFDVEYTIELTPEYEEELKRYRELNGKEPENYLKLQLVYRTAADQIKEVMPRLKLFSKYFEMLKTLTFLTSYFKTMQKCGLAPSLPQLETVNNIVPKAFPPIPVRYFTFHKLNITVDAYLKKLIELMKVSAQPKELLNATKIYIEDGTAMKLSATTEAVIKHAF